ncbi:MAG: purine-nucleoside phosphorylase [Chloroflexi bacterium]|nr:purine-nucleoside phosphorylase [Chloroflexota bacterium]
MTETARLIAARYPSAIEVGIITGSGLGGLAEAVEERVSIPYQEIPNFPVSTVEGHPGQLILGRLAGKAVFLMQGRAHYYEGYSLEEATFPLRVMRAMGAGVLMVTNAAGGLNPRFRPGDLMLITDHINLLGMAGETPLRGLNDERLGPRFPPMLGAYDSKLIKLAQEVGKRLGIILRQGVYIMLAGPTFESPAEVRMLRRWGGDAVGMSTVGEVIVARHGGMRVLGISLISNLAMAENHTAAPDTHQDVLAAAEKAVPKLIRLIKGVLERI